MIHGGRHPGRWGEDGMNELAFGWETDVERNGTRGRK
jgi:hypothetical protein